MGVLSHEDSHRPPKESLSPSLFTQLIPNDTLCFPPHPRQSWLRHVWR